MSKPDRGGIEICAGTVRPEWIDINGHMNVAYYVLAFDLAVDALWTRFGITEEHIETTQGSTFAVESHITYKRELKEAEPYRVTAQIIAYDEKRVHQFQRMYHAEENYLAATAEWMNLYVDLRTRKVARWPDSILQEFAKLVKSQQNLTLPLEAGRKMHIANPIFSVQGE
jgi:acyl-CoA thioester hydrolase